MRLEDNKRKIGYQKIYTRLIKLKNTRLIMKNEHKNKFS